MNHQERTDKVAIKKAQNVLFASNKPEFNFHFVKDEEIAENALQQPDKELILPMNMYDYSCKTTEGSDMEMPKLVPMSLAGCRDNLDDMTAWYAAKFPRLPNEYHGVLARYSSRQLLTKKEVKNELKKVKRKKKEIPVGLEIAKGNFTVKFD